MGRKRDWTRRDLGVRRIRGHNQAGCCGKGLGRSHGADRSASSAVFVEQTDAEIVVVAEAVGDFSLEISVEAGGHALCPGTMHGSAGARRCAEANDFIEDAVGHFLLGEFG